MTKTKIQWTEKVWNPITGCTKISEGCKNCYAESIANRFWKDRKFTDVICHEERLQEPLKVKKPSMFFVNSMSDLFHEKVPFEFIDKVMAIAHCSVKHTFQILTKRPHLMYKYFNDTNLTFSRIDIAHFDLKLKNVPLREFPLSNIWLGVTVENQKAANERIPYLLQTPAEVRFLSVEPMLEKINLQLVGCSKCGKSKNFWAPNYSLCRNCGHEVKYPPNQIDWVIIGCESGLKKRECKIEWVEDLVEQCKAAQVPVFVKQLNINGKVVKNLDEFPEHLRIREYPKQ